MGLYSIVRPMVFTLDAERAHELTLAALKLKPGAAPPAPDPVLATRIAGMDFPNPIGLAAGFDKNGEVPDAMLGLGFGFVEIGTITPLPQDGNPKPRLFRLTEDEAVINRMGFNNGGQAAALERLSRRAGQGGIVGVNIGANKDSADRIADYVHGVRTMVPVADYLTVNISSPNTPGLRALQDAGALTALLDAVMNMRGMDGPPLFLKVAPDLETADIDDIARIAIDARIEGLIVSNTTIARPPLRNRHAGETGGLSGAPLRDVALQRIRDFRTATGSALPLIGAGGIASGEDAYRRIRAGASLIQLYSALVYHGPGLARRIASELKALLERDGFSRVIEAVGEP
ncbi:quinone-dependent dihydroorotate dehydrogenase [Sphingomonas colocasiae]|uniref:Dihydroorotate dehydrogenase (quinone) n=1 Tax=Sphingomonas colocasiae TaxID=1848973 RepID=A0ABS7PT66_9SPHN|nr:quinone-dependent dihydroorotate dehydrogenase [Sphingomonas colocasiae]MBY8824543.1 quinone-dependent dihydroorotate dehydrogenase [Sphingomonas colocasiae]